MPPASMNSSMTGTGYAEGRRRPVAALWYTTDAMLTGHHSDEQLWIFVR